MPFVTFCSILRINLIETLAMLLDDLSIPHPVCATAVECLLSFRGVIGIGPIQCWVCMRGLVVEGPRRRMMILLWRCRRRPALLRPGIPFGIGVELTKAC